MNEKEIGRQFCAEAHVLAREGDKKQIQEKENLLQESLCLLYVANVFQQKGRLRASGPFLALKTGIVAKPVEKSGQLLAALVAVAFGTQAPSTSPTCPRWWRPPPGALPPTPPLAHST